MDAGAPAAPDRPDHVDAARAMFVALLGVAAVRALAQSINPDPEHPAVSLEVFGLVQQAVFLTVPLLYAKTVRLRPLEANGYVRLPWGKVALVLLASLGTMWLLQGLNAAQPALFRWLGLEKEMTREIEDLRHGLEVTQSKGVLVSGFVYVIVSPFCEETLFRGLVFRGLARRFGSAMPILFTSLLFAMMHDTKVQFALMLVLGLFFATLIRLTGSLWAGILAHAANNGAVLLLTSAYGSGLEALRGPWFMYPLSALVLAGALVLLALDRPRSGPTLPR